MIDGDAASGATFNCTDPAAVELTCMHTDMDMHTDACTHVGSL